MTGFQVLTVSQLHRFVKSLLSEQKQLSDLMVQGELSNLSQNSTSGHLYFSIRDNGGLMRCVMFSRYAQGLRQLPQPGAMVLLRGSVSLYERDGSFQMVVYDLQQLGAGVQQVSLDQLKEKLMSEGLFSAQHKQPLPELPQTVGIITSRDGAALQDILRTFRSHNPAVKLLLYPAAVQGSTAPQAICQSLDLLEAEGLCDCVIIARGGGSAEDLAPFNDEGLARRVFACRVPVISAVGHEVDFSILDLVADARAATPTAAVQLAAPSREALLEQLDQLEERLTQLQQQAVSRRQNRLAQLDLLLDARSPEQAVKKNRQRHQYLVKLFMVNQQSLLTRLEERLQHATHSLSRLNPAALMARGYTITTQEGRVLTRGADAQPGQLLQTQFPDGELTSSVVAFAPRKDGAS